MLSAALQRGSPHSQAAASAAAAEPAPGAAQMEDWAQAPKQAQEEPNLAAAPDLATAPDLGQEQLLGRARDEVLLITSRIRAKGELQTVTYPVADIVAATAHFRAAGCMIISEPVAAAAFPGRRIAWLMGPSAEAVTGATLPVDGGLSL